MNQNEILIKVGIWIRPRFAKYEIILALITVIGVFLKLLNIHGSQLLLTFSLGLIANLHFFYAFAPFEEENITGIDGFIKYLMFWSLSIASLGILFTILCLKGNDQMLMMGTITLTFIALISIAKSRNENELRKFYKSNAIRSIIYIIICLFLLLTPKEKLKPLLSCQYEQTEQTK
jgi:hypothetical protein